MEVRLNSRIYPESAVEQAVKDYSKIAKINVIREQAYYRLKISTQGDHSDNEFILKEFTNHVLGLTKKCLWGYS